MAADTNNKKRSLFSYSSFHFLDDGISDSLYILLPLIAAELHLTLAEVGVIKGAFSASMSLLQLPVALLGERIGELNIIAIGSVSLSAGFFMVGAAYTLAAVLAALILGKSLCAGQHALSSAMLSREFEDSGRRTALGTYNFAGDIGKVCLPFLLALMISQWGWRPATQIFAGAAIFASIVLWSISRKNALRPLHTDGRGSEKGWGINNRRGFASLLTIGFMDYSVRAGLLTFLPFLLIEKGVSVTEAGFALTLVFAGGAAGKFICGVLAEWFGICAMIVSTEVATALCVIGTFYLPITYLWYVLPILGVGLNGTSSVLYASVAEMTVREKRSRGYGLYYAVTLGAGISSPILFGIIGQIWTLQSSFLLMSLCALLTLPFLFAMRLPSGQ